MSSNRLTGFICENINALYNNLRTISDIELIESTTDNEQAVKQLYSNIKQTGININTKINTIAHNFQSTVRRNSHSKKIIENMHNIEPPRNAQDRNKQLKQLVQHLIEIQIIVHHLENQAVVNMRKQLLKNVCNFFINDFVFECKIWQTSK